MDVAAENESEDDLDRQVVSSPTDDVTAKGSSSLLDGPQQGNWLWAPAAKVAEYKAQVQRVKTTFQDFVEIDDPTMEWEYAEEIFNYMSHLEVCCCVRCTFPWLTGEQVDCMPSPNYIDGQTEITWAMRVTLVDWLLQVHLRYHLLPETLWIAINIVDRFLTKRVVSLVKLQLVGVTAMFVAAKYEEIIAPR